MQNQVCIKKKNSGREEINAVLDADAQLHWSENKTQEKWVSVGGEKNTLPHTTVCSAKKTSDFSSAHHDLMLDEITCS